MVQKKKSKKKLFKIFLEKQSNIKPFLVKKIKFFDIKNRLSINYLYNSFEKIEKLYKKNWNNQTSKKINSAVCIKTTNRVWIISKETLKKTKIIFIICILSELK